MITCHTDGGRAKEHHHSNRVDPSAMRTQVYSSLLYESENELLPVRTRKGREGNEVKTQVKGGVFCL